MLIQSNVLTVRPLLSVWPLELDDLPLGRRHGELAAEPRRDVHTEMMVTGLIFQHTTQRDDDAVRGLSPGGHSQDGNERPCQ